MVLTDPLWLDSGMNGCALHHASHLLSELGQQWHVPHLNLYEQVASIVTAVSTPPRVSSAVTHPRVQDKLLLSKPLWCFGMTAACGDRLWDGCTDCSTVDAAPNNIICWHLVTACSFLDTVTWARQVRRASHLLLGSCQLAASTVSQSVQSSHK